VRGLDYYTRTTWEFVGPEAGAQSAISGGGRYDYLIEEIGGPATPGVGFGAGIERLHFAVESQPAHAQSIEVFFALDSSARRGEVLAMLARLRSEGRACDMDYAGRSLKGQLTHAQRLGAEAVVIVGKEDVTVRRSGRDDLTVASVEEAVAAL
jgi:histidyl-tRNA synthetase